MKLYFLFSLALFLFFKLTKAEDGQLDAKYLNYSFSNKIIKDMSSYFISGDQSNMDFFKAFDNYIAYYYDKLTIVGVKDKIVDFDRQSFNNIFNTIQHWVQQDRHPIEIWCASNLITDLDTYLNESQFTLSSEAEVIKYRAELKKLCLKLAEVKLNEHVIIRYITCTMKMIESDDKVSLKKMLSVLAKKKNISDVEKKLIQYALTEKNILMDTDEEEK
jgi:hypothetical protein